MNAMPFDSLTAMCAAVAQRSVSASELCGAALARIASRDSQLHAFVDVWADSATRRAAEIDVRLARGESPGPLAGVPICVKDNICTRVGHTTCASRMLADYRSPYDAHVIDMLESAGANVIGKTNLDEFAMGSSSENSALGPTQNPWNTQCVSGGSSSGSAAAVAARLTLAALGSDTGGSIRQPAALCGVTGIKPTYGRVSRYGLVAFGSSLDQIGVFAVSAADAALVLRSISGHDPRDSTSADRPTSDLVIENGTSIKGLRVGVPAAFFGDGLNAEVARAVIAACDALCKMGAVRVDVSLPHSQYCLPTYYIISSAEASSNLARFDGVHYGRRTPAPRDYIDVYAASRAEGFGDEVKRRIMLGTYVLSSGYYDAFYDKASRVRTLIADDYAAAFKACDVILGPTSPMPAFRLGEKSHDPLSMYLADVYTLGANLAGVPAISVPCGFTADGLPIGMQLTGNHFCESVLLRAAAAYQRETDWHTRKPP